MSETKKKIILISKKTKTSTPDCSTDDNCPICHNVIVEPVATTCGHIFCYYCLYFYRKSHCPLCNQDSLPSSFIRHNKRNKIYNVNQIIKDYLRKKYSDYDERNDKLKKEFDLNSKRILYKRSKRCQNIRKLIKKIIAEKGYISAEDILTEFKDYHPIEIKMIVNMSSNQLFVIGKHIVIKSVAKAMQFIKETNAPKAISMYTLACVKGIRDEYMKIEGLTEPPCANEFVFSDEAFLNTLSEKELLDNCSHHHDSDSSESESSSERTNITRRHLSTNFLAALIDGSMSSYSDDEFSD